MDASCPPFSRNCWWYSSAGQKAGAGEIAVTIDDPRSTSSRRFQAVAASCCSALWVKTSLRYCVPWSSFGFGLARSWSKVRCDPTVLWQAAVASFFSKTSSSY